MNSFEITSLTVNDAAAFRDLRLAALLNAPQAFGSSFAAESTQPLSFFEDRLRTSTIFAARQNSALIATAALAGANSAREKHKGFIWGVFVAPTARGSGVAQALLAALLSHAGQHFEQVTLTVNATNLPALALYRRAGFEIYGKEPRSLKDETGYSDEVLMVRFTPQARTFR